MNNTDPFDDSETRIPSQSQETVNEAIRELTSKKNLELKSRLQKNIPRIVETISRAEVFAEHFNLPALKKYLEKFKAHTVSIEGKGRTEMVQALQYQQQINTENDITKQLQQVIKG